MAGERRERRGEREKKRRIERETGKEEGGEGREEEKKRGKVRWRREVREEKEWCGVKEKKVERKGKKKEIFSPNFQIYKFFFYNLYNKLQ